MTNYTGEIRNCTSGGGAFIGRASILKDGQTVDFEQDIFVHQDDVPSIKLAEGVVLQFSTAPDIRRPGAFRAVEVRLPMREMATVGASAFALSDPQRFYVPPTRAQAAAPRVKAEAVQQALNNKPLEHISRQAGARIDADEFLASIFPQFRQLGASDEFDRKIKALISEYRSHGMNDQVALTEKQAGVYAGLRTILRNADDLLQPASILPLSYLPDLFMAVPVWYHYTDKLQYGSVVQNRQGNDPQISTQTRYFCNLIGTQRWADTFQMYNRRSRGLQDYRGDLIPAHIMERMRILAPHFDQLVIMTPYHDVAGQDWQNISWLRSIDPYVVGFIQGVPFMFVVARFSDSGVFPLYHELLGGTIEFLRQNKNALLGFNQVENPYWIMPESDRGDHIFRSKSLGTHLMNHASNLIAAFEKGELFTWLRERSPRATAR